MGHRGPAPRPAQALATASARQLHALVRRHPPPPTQATDLHRRLAELCARTSQRFRSNQDFEAGAHLPGALAQRAAPLPRIPQRSTLRRAQMPGTPSGIASGAARSTRISAVNEAAVRLRLAEARGAVERSWGTPNQRFRSNPELDAGHRVSHLSTEGGAPWCCA
jgi:hypothetical protein